MVRAWYMDDDQTKDQKLEHHLDPPQYIPIEEVYKKSGVEYFKLNLDTYRSDGILDNIRTSRGYSYEDESSCSKECLPDYDNMLKKFFAEHLHTDEEIRFILDGSGYFDVRDADDKWIRIHVVAGDLLIIPAGIYHRFTLDTTNYIKAKRYFVGEPVWLPYDRPADEMDCRKDYVERLARGFQ